MFAGVCIGANDLEDSGLFYDRVLATIGMQRAFENASEIGYAGDTEHIDFWVLLPFDKQSATHGNGTQIMFKAKNHDQVKAFYEQAILHGGSDAGPPGPRDYHPGYYGAYCRDLVGNKLHVFYRP